MADGSAMGAKTVIGIARNKEKLKRSLSNRINEDAFVESRPMSNIVETFDEIHKLGSSTRRIVLTPHF